MLTNRSAPNARVTPVLTVADVRASVAWYGEVFGLAVARGAVLVDPVHDWEYGERQATLDDPFGHQWVLNQTLSDVAPEEWGGETVTPHPSPS